MKMKKEQTKKFLRDVYAEWILNNQNAAEKGLMFYGYISQRDDFHHFSFGRVSAYQMTAIWVREWNGE
jgi:hypothetical protein